MITTVALKVLCKCTYEHVTCIYVCMCVYVYVCMYVCVYVRVCMYVFSMYVCIAGGLCSITLHCFFSRILSFMVNYSRTSLHCSF